MKKIIRRLSRFQQSSEYQQQFHRLFDLMPYDIQQKAIVAYNDIVTDTRSEFVYGSACEAHRHNLGVLL